MSFGISRLQLQGLAEAKRADAELLLRYDRYGNAFYLAGYAVEIGLKAVIARRFLADTIPDPKLVRSVYTHALHELLALAELRQQFEVRQDADAAFASNWQIVSSWTGDARYADCDARTATRMVEAVGSASDGVLPWLTTFW